MSKQNKSKTLNNIVFAYVFNGGVLKQNHCVVGVSTEHPETTIFNELKEYYGNDIKGAFYKCTKTLEEVQAGIDFKLKDQKLSKILFNNNFTETKKILLDITGLKQCTGTINTYKKDDSDEAKEKSTQKSKDKDNDKDKEDSSDSSDGEEKTKKSKGKTKKESDKVEKESKKADKTEKSDKKQEKEKKDKKADKETKTKNKIQISDDDESEQDTKKSDKKKEMKNNKTSIELSDSDSDEEAN